MQAVWIAVPNERITCPHVLLYINTLTSPVPVSVTLQPPEAPETGRGFEVVRGSSSGGHANCFLCKW